MSSPFAEPKIGEFGNGDYLGAVQKATASVSVPTNGQDAMMGGKHRSPGLSQIGAVALLLTLGSFLLDCALFPPFAKENMETIRRQNRGAWLFLIAIMLSCGAALFAGGQILFFGAGADTAIKRAEAPAEESNEAPM